MNQHPTEVVRVENASYMGQKVSWCVKVIYNASIRAKTRKNRWLKDALTLNTPNEDGGEIIDSVQCQKSFEDFINVELIQCLQTLPKAQARVLEELYCHGYSQQEVAEHLETSQQQVSRLKSRGLKTLRAGVSV